MPADRPARLSYWFRCVRCDWPRDQVTHGPVEPGCPDPSAHHEYRERFGSEAAAVPQAGVAA